VKEQIANFKWRLEDMAHKQALSLSPQTLRSVPFIELRQSPASDRVAYFIAHDLRHHLSAVYANAELMCHKHYVQSEREEMLEDIKGAVACMIEALGSLLVHSRTGCLLQLRLEPLKLIIEKATQMVRSHPDADRVEFIHENMPLVEVSADSTWLCSAIFNLLLNACQALQLSSDLKKVSVTCHEGPNDVYIRIIDNGPGVPVTIQKSLFQPFVSLGLRKGTGLGLAIVNSIVREHGGDVSLEESRPGNTSFVVRLPRPDTFKTNAHVPEATV
jgi:signal transduction histidine kinase